MFLANGSSVKCVFSPKNGPVPGQTVNGCTRQRQSGLLFTVCLLALAGLDRVEASEDVKAWQKTIVELEKLVFDPVLTADEVDRLLVELKTPDNRAAAAKRLCDQGRGHVERILVFARSCPDIEARQACADVVEALDSSYRTTDRGRQLGVLYREHAEELLPTYWARFRKDPLDQRAVAMLMQDEPYNIYRLLAKSGGRRDMARFLLLRIRELSPDKFAANQLDNHTATGLLLVMADVFPYANYQWNHQIFSAAHRVVGHTYLNVVHICSSEPLQPVGSQPIIRRGKTESLLPSVGEIELNRRLVGLFVNNAGKVYCLGVDSRNYQSRKLRHWQGWSGRRLHILETDEGLCRLPKLDVKSKTKLPWFVEPYVPTAYRAKMRFTKRAPGENPPAAIPARHANSSALLGKRAARPAAPMDSSAPAVVILPPRLPDAADWSARAEAELACDRLAEEIAAEGIARVLDRSQLDRILEEKRLSGDWSKPAVAFDAMIRLEVDVPSLVPEARMTLIDLSHGNVMKESRCAWPMREDDLSQMVGCCREGLKRARQPEKGKLKVRCLRAENEEKNPRLKPLICRLELVFDEAVARSPQLTPVRHLEAASAKEESLLLLMGLSRLPGGRRFSPQADATVELSVREGDGRGKTFDETPVEITARVIRGDASGDQSFTVVATVAEFDTAAAQTWAKLAGLLREARSDAATDWLDDLAARRSQAEAELRAAKAIDIMLQRGTTRYDQAIHDRLAHAEAAIKLDPTMEDAIVEHLRMLRTECSLSKGKMEREKTDELAESILTNVLRYFDRFGLRAKYRHEAHDACCLAIDASLGQLDTSIGMELTSQQLKLVQMTKLILEDAVKHGGLTTGSIHRNMSTTIYSRATALTVVGRAMKRNGVPLAERQQWIDGILQECTRSESELPKVTSDDRYLRIRQQLDRDMFMLDCDELWLRAAELAVEDVCLDRAGKLVVQLQNRIRDAKRCPRMSPIRHPGSIIPRLRVVVLRMDDADRLAKFDHWTTGGNRIYVSRKQIRWPSVDVFQDRKNVAQGRYRRSDMPSVKGVAICREPRPHEGGPRSIRPLVEGDGRRYLAINYNLWRQFGGNTLSTPSQMVGYVPLDKSGRPVGKTYQLSKYPRKEFWDSLKLLPEPPVEKPLSILDAKYVAGKLYIGTSKRGLLEFDPKGEKWSIFGPEQGLPKEGVSRIFPLNERTLFCVGSLAYRRPVCFTLELPNGKVTLLHRVKEALDNPGPKLLWRDGKRLFAWGKQVLYDDLLSRELRFTPIDFKMPYGWIAPQGHHGFSSPDGRWGIRSMAEVAGRRFLTRGGLHEFNSSGKIIQSWWRETSIHNVRPPATCPVNSDKMVAMGDMLAFLGKGRVQFARNVVIWDPKTDTWYGPLGVVAGSGAESNRSLGPRGGLWLSTSNGVLFVSAEDLLATAKSAGRVMTTAEYQQRQRETIAIMPPLDQAKMAISMREFDAAEKLLNQILASDANCAEALLLLGYVNDLWCANRPEKALEYYRRLAELESNPRASYTGMYHRLALLQSQKRWPEALEAVEEINQTFSGQLNPFAQRRLEASWKHIIGQLSEQDAKHPGG